MKRLATALGLAIMGLAGWSALDARPQQMQGDDAARNAITDYARLLMVLHRPNDAFARYYAHTLIQHDPWIGDGGAGDDSFLEARRKLDPTKFDATDQYKTTVDAILADGDLVAIKSHVFTNPHDHGRVFVDMWRMENGRFAEHWDVIQPVGSGPGEANLAAAACGVAITYQAASDVGDSVAKPSCGAPDRTVDKEASRRTVLAYMALGQQPGHIREAVERYLAPDFVQHSGNIPAGREGLITYLEQREAQRRADHRTSVIARSLADGDMVLVHRLVTSASNPRGTAYMDLFRVRDGRIVAHWDVVQPIPAFSASGRAMVQGPLEPGRVHRAPRPEEME